MHFHISNESNSVGCIGTLVGVAKGLINIWIAFQVIQSSHVVFRPHKIIFVNQNPKSLEFEGGGVIRTITLYYLYPTCLIKIRVYRQSI